MWRVGTEFRETEYGTEGDMVTNTPAMGTHAHAKELSIMGHTNSSDLCEHTGLGGFHW